MALSKGEAAVGHAIVTAFVGGKNRHLVRSVSVFGPQGSGPPQAEAGAWEPLQHPSVCCIFPAFIDPHGLAQLCVRAGKPQHHTYHMPSSYSGPPSVKLRYLWRP